MPRALADPLFPTRLRELRQARGLSLRQLAGIAYLAKSTLSDLENGRKSPTPQTARAVDRALGAGGELAGMVTEATSDPARQVRLWEVSELLDRLRMSDVSTATVEALHLTAHGLCCEYGWRDAAELRGDGLRWLREVERLLRRPVGLAHHRELLTVAGWLALLAGCAEYDLGLRPAAESTRAAALHLATEGGNGEVAAWAWEMAAWFALTQGRYRDVVAAVEAGQARSGEHTAAVQLLGQEAKARARMADLPGVRAALGRGRRLLDRSPRPAHPEHHFVVDPDKWDFYAMDAYRIAGDDDLARHHAEQVLRLGAGPDGAERAPMRMAEARLTLGAVAARSGELEQAADVGMAAFNARRRSLPSLLMVARELATELRQRDPGGRPWVEFRDAVQEVSTVSAG
jgi:transcriptional regulator with XRE-family HTH domain